MAQQQESSVEDILDSIKKVIARDNRDMALKVKKHRGVLNLDETATDDEDLETLNLTEQVQDSDNVSDADERAAEILDLGAMECVGDTALEEAECEAEKDEPESEENVPSDNHESPLINDKVRGAMQENLAALAMLAEPSAKPQIVRSGETSLEGLTRELIRPMLAEWLDKNLPGMVEKMVQAEIARIAGKHR